MSQFQMIRKIQKKKILQTKHGKQEAGWNERFYLERIPNYTPSMEPNQCIRQYKNQINTTKKQMGYNSNNNHKGNLIGTVEEQEAYFDLDSDMVELWNTLCVTDDYRKKFQQKLMYFKEEVHWHILNHEKQSLKKIYDFFMTIKSELSLRDKSIELLTQLNEGLRAEKNIFNEDENLMKNIKECVHHINQKSISIISTLIELRKIYYYDYMKGKYDKSKTNVNELFETNFLCRLNQNVQCLFNNEPFKSFLQIKGTSDPVFLDLFPENNNDENNSAFIDNCYVVLNEMVYSNYIFLKEKNNSANITSLNKTKLSNKSQSKSKISIDNQARGTIDTKKYINNPYINQNSNTSLKKVEESKLSLFEKKKNSIQLRNEERNVIKIEKEVIDCNNKNECKSLSHCSNSMMNKDKYSEKDKNEFGKRVTHSQVSEYNHHPNEQLKNNSLEVKESKKERNKTEINELKFYTGSLSSLQKTYEAYYNLIPSSQKSTFDLNDDINKFNEGISPMLIVSYYKESLSSLCLLSLDPEDPQIIIIEQISTLSNNISEMFLKIIMFIQDNIFYKELVINLNFEMKKDQYSLNKELTDVFKGLNFKWSKLENLNCGKRIQTMKYKNKNTNNNNETTSLNHLSYIHSGMFAWEVDRDNNRNNNDEDNTMQNNKDKILINSKTNGLNKTVIDYMIQKSNKAKDIKNAFSNLITFVGGKKEAIAFIKEHEVKDNKILTELDFIQDDDKQLYISMYTLYPLFKTLSTHTINQYIYNRLEIKNEVLYEKETNQTFYMLQQDDYVIVLGEITEGFKSCILQTNSIDDAFNSLYEKIEIIQRDITHIWVPSFSIDNNLTEFGFTEWNVRGKYYTEAYLNATQNQGKTFSQEPKETDRVISNVFFLGIISVSLSNSCSISAIFCDIIDQNRWKSF